MSKHPRVEHDLAWLNRHKGSMLPGLAGGDTVTNAMWNSNLSLEARLFSALKLGWDSETPAPVWTVRRVERKSSKWDYTLKSRLNWWGGCFALVEYIIWKWDCLKIWGFCSALQTVMFWVGVSEFMVTCHSLSQHPLCSLSWTILAKHK